MVFALFSVDSLGLGEFRGREECRPVYKQKYKNKDIASILVTFL
jgi:hypothetical protein